MEFIVLIKVKYIIIVQRAGTREKPYTTAKCLYGR